MKISDSTKETIVYILKYIGYALAIIGIILVTALLSVLTKKKSKLNKPKPPIRRETIHSRKTRQRKMYYAKKYGGSRFK